MNPMQNYMQQQMEYSSSTPKIEMCKIIPSQQPQFSRSALFRNIQQIDQLTDAELAEFIERNLDKILFKTFNGNEIIDHIKAFQNVRFLDALIKILGQIKWFNKDQILSLNTIAYNYITAPDTEAFHKDYQIIDRYITISNLINRAELPRLLGLGYTETLANMLLIARYSDNNPSVIIKRLDFIIITQPSSLMSQKMITDTLRILFDVFTDTPRIFPYYMEDVLPREEWVTDEIEENDSTMQLSMLEIIDNLPTNLIFETLRGYAEGWQMMGRKPVRFSMKRLSDDYYRINSVVYQLMNVEGVVVP